jgi:hypothetical protein
MTVKSKNPRSHLEKADRKGTRTDQHLAFAGTAASATPFFDNRTSPARFTCKSPGTSDYRFTA